MTYIPSLRTHIHPRSLKISSCLSELNVPIAVFNIVPDLLFPLFSPDPLKVLFDLKGGTRRFGGLLSAIKCPVTSRPLGRGQGVYFHTRSSRLSTCLITYLTLLSRVLFDAKCPVRNLKRYRNPFSRTPGSPFHHLSATGDAQAAGYPK